MFELNRLRRSNLGLFVITYVSTCFVLSKHKGGVTVNMEQIKKELSIQFDDDALLTQAFTHSSYVNEHQQKRLTDNERLEFLGDAVLELAVSDFLFKKYTKMKEGEMTKLRANIVCEESLYYFANILKLHKYILLGKGEERTGGRHRQALLADVFEAFLGALYLDQGMASCQRFLEKYIFPHITADAFSHGMDYKTQLQEIVQKEKGSKIEYCIVDEKGPSHAKQFKAQLLVNGKNKTIGIGKTKKEAEQNAAKSMLERFKQK